MPYRDNNWFSGYKPKLPVANEALKRSDKKPPPKIIEYSENQTFFVEPVCLKNDIYIKELERLWRLNQILDGYKYDQETGIMRLNQKITKEKRKIIQNLIITAKKNIDDLQANTR